MASQKVHNAVREIAGGSELSLFWPTQELLAYSGGGTDRRGCELTASRMLEPGFFCTAQAAGKISLARACGPPQTRGKIRIGYRRRVVKVEIS